MLSTPSRKPYAPSQLKILFYAPFKPLGHPHPSGDLITAKGIYSYLKNQGHELVTASRLRCRWIYWKPWLWPKLIFEGKRLVQQFGDADIDLWFTYHSYYKAPDLLGSAVCRRLKIPYVIFQGIYSTKRRRKLKTRIGFHLNKNTLRAADHIFCNKKVDLLNLKRLVAESRLSFISPGLQPDDFCFDANARTELRAQWNVGDDPVILSAAMFRPGVKTEGLTWVIRTCGELFRNGQNLWLAIAGDGKEKTSLHRLADEHLPGRVRFVGEVPRKEIHRFYSAGDLFVFPGINESLGMVYLEAQSCGLPVVGFENAGVPEAVQNSRTGILVPMYDSELFADAITRFLTNPDLRRKMGKTAKAYVREMHDIHKNYQELESRLYRIVEEAQSG